MNRIVDVVDVLNTYRKLQHGKPMDEFMFATVLNKTPDADAVSVVHAHWIERRANNGNVHYLCSHCGKEVSYSYAKKRWKYCIECGAKMDEEAQ